MKMCVGGGYAGTILSVEALKNMDPDPFVMVTYGNNDSNFVWLGRKLIFCPCMTYFHIISIYETDI